MHESAIFDTSYATLVWELHLIGRTKLSKAPNSIKVRITYILGAWASRI